MLLKKLNEINLVLKELIFITIEDIENIKEAKHEKVFKNISKKEELAKRFEKLKSEIDSILVSRNKPIEEIFSNEEEIEFENFKNNLNEFYKHHKHFARLSMTVHNFYENLLNKIKNKKQITYDKKCNPNPYLKLKA